MLRLPKSPTARRSEVGSQPLPRELPNAHDVTGSLNEPRALLAEFDTRDLLPKWKPNRDSTKFDLHHSLLRSRRPVKVDGADLVLECLTNALEWVAKSMDELAPRVEESEPLMQVGLKECPVQLRFWTDVACHA
jgi:hypothetical protein